MIVASMVLAAALSGWQDKVELARKFKEGERHTFSFTSRVDVDVRVAPEETFIPEVRFYDYTFTAAVERLKPDGIADVRFKRDKIREKSGETFDGTPKTEVMDVKHNYLFTLSRANQVLALKDETPKKEEKTGPMMSIARFGTVRQLGIEDWIGQLYQFAGFINFFDLGPILPTRPVAIGDTWKETKGYTPATIGTGRDAKAVMARIDYVYTYKGNTEYNGKQVVWIQGKASQDTDGVPYIAGLLGVEPKRLIFSEIKIKMEVLVDYYLDNETLCPLTVKGQSTGSASISIRTYSGPVEELKLKGEATLVRR